MYTEVSNVWASQAKTPEEAVALQARADLLISLREIIYNNGWSPKEAAQHLGLTQNRVSYIATGQVSKFSTDKLLGLLSKVGYQVDMAVRAA
ncbi:MAG: XRE family transcriptional regulator [Pseudomonadales bacterium]